MIGMIQKQKCFFSLGLGILILFLSVTCHASDGAMTTELSDGEYAISFSFEGGSGKATIENPTILTVKNHQCYADINWGSSYYDYMVVNGIRYDNRSEEGRNSSFQIPVTCMDDRMEVIADTLAMGTPHEITYELCFYRDSIGSKGTLPREAAKRVLIMAAVIIIGGGILNRYVKKKRKV